MKRKVTLYICQRDNHCRVPCSQDCHLTSDPEHSEYGGCKDPENHPERFEMSETSTYIYYTEKENY